MMREKRSRSLSFCSVRSKTIATARTTYQPVAVTCTAAGVDLHQPGLGHRLQRLQLAREVLAHVDQVRQFDRLELDPPLAHQRHDHGAAQQVVARQREAAHAPATRRWRSAS